MPFLIGPCSQARVDCKRNILLSKLKNITHPSKTLGEKIKLNVSGVAT